MNKVLILAFALACQGKISVTDLRKFCSWADAPYIYPARRILDTNLETYVIENCRKRAERGTVTYLIEANLILNFILAHCEIDVQNEIYFELL